MIIFIGFIIGMFLVILIGTTLAINNFDKNVVHLFRQSPSIKGEVLALGKENLPTPVWRYFLYAFKERQPYISYVRLKHSGTFKTSLNGKWQDITGEEYFTVDKPGFIWKGRIGFLTAIDSYVAGQGSLKVYLFSVLRIANGTGPKFTQGELLRWLGESVWFPTALLPGDGVRWESIDDYHARLEFTCDNVNVHYIVTFNENAEITTLETMRYIDGRSLHIWIGKLSNYEMQNGMMIPTTIEAVWKIEGREFPYAVFNVSQIEYDKPAKFDS